MNKGNEPAELIEREGYIYKLHTSKEERRKLDEEAAEKRTRNFGAFKQKIGSKQYDYLHEKGVTLTYATGGNYSIDVFYDFANDLTWSQDEYSSSDKKHFGDADWYTYDGKFENSFATVATHKMIQDYFFGLLTKQDAV